MVFIYFYAPQLRIYHQYMSVLANSINLYSAFPRITRLLCYLIFFFQNSTYIYSRNLHAVNHMPRFVIPLASVNFIFDWNSYRSHHQRRSNAVPYRSVIRPKVVIILMANNFYVFWKWTDKIKTANEFFFPAIWISTWKNIYFFFVRKFST